MTNLLKGISIFLMVILFASCDSCATKQEVQEKEEAKKEQTKGITEALEGLEGGTAGLSEALKNVAEAVSGGEVEEVEIVNFRDMKPLLPKKIAGLELVDTEGSTSGAFGFKASTLTGLYGKGDRTMKIEIIDTGGIGKAFLGVVPWATMEVDKESKGRYERTTEYKGMKAFEEFDTKREKGSLSLLAGERFVIKGEGRGMSMKEIKGGMDDFPYKKLIKMGEKK